jgi:Rps23 Pro-64 3,4-dihydroxylase Tpa1-like proline 4-hydroxylase
MIATAESRTSTVLSYLRCQLSLNKSVEDLLDQYRSARPFPHLVLDSLFPEETLSAVLEESSSMSRDKWVHNQDEHIIKTNMRSAVDLGDRAYDFASFLHSAAFLYFMSEITGIKALLPDPYLTGGGYHIVPEGGKFDIHADRNTDHHSGLHRRLAMLVYLNPNWKTENGGQLELWNQDGSACEKVIEPIFNRTVIFEIGDKNFHAVRPVTQGCGLKRRSFCVYFHTNSNNFVMHNSIFAPPIYQSRSSMARRISREITPPFLVRTLKNLKSKG